MAEEETEEERRERIIRTLRAILPNYNSQIMSSEEKLNRYDEDYAKYVKALEQLQTVSKGVIAGQGDINSGNSALPNYAGGNKYGEASGAISAVSGMFGAVASNGIGSIVKYIQADMLLLNEKYTGEYPKYVRAIDNYNSVAARIRSWGGNCSNQEQKITKSSLA